MIKDVAPELLERIRNDFKIKFEENEKIKELYELMASGNATYKEVNEFAIETGRILTIVFANDLSSNVLPDGKMYFNIANRIIPDTLKKNHELVTDAGAQVQKSLNEKAGIRIRAIKPEINQDRIAGLVNKVSSADLYDSVAWVLAEPVINFTQSIVDDMIKANADFQYDAGMSPEIIRSAESKCCEWCSKLAGKYKYPDVPKDVYRRHERCRCMVEYDPKNGKNRVQNVHTKKWKTPEERDKIEKRKAIGQENESNSEKIEYRKHIGENNLSYAESRALTNYVSSDSYVINDKLRSGYELTDAEKMFCTDLDNALKKMPTYSGNLSRSLYFYTEEEVLNFIKEFQEGQTIKFAEYISTTKGTNLYNPEGQVQIYVEDSLKGRNLGSFNEQELEVLYERNMRFRVKRKITVEKKWYILLEED